jgi:holo-[acyl-carrier protein] synthase
VTSPEPTSAHAGGAVRATVGVDLVDVSRLSRLTDDPEGLATLLTQRERSYCLSRPHPAQHVAARFAAKEAVLKTFGTGRTGGIRWLDVEVRRGRSGKPAIALHGRRTRPVCHRHLALAHARACDRPRGRDVGRPGVPVHTINRPTEPHVPSCIHPR